MGSWAWQTKFRPPLGSRMMAAKCFGLSIMRLRLGITAVTARQYSLPFPSDFVNWWRPW